MSSTTAFMCRLPSALHAKVLEQASENGRSMNSEIVIQLERAYGGMVSGDRERAFKDALAMLSKASLPTRFKLVVDEDA